MLEVTDVRVTYGEIVAVDDLSLTVPEGSTTVVMGPSGCGKSTLLRVVAGLTRPETGTVCWMEQDVSELPPRRRGFGLMFQDYALFPHRSVGDNVAFGLRMARWERPDIAGRVEETLRLVGLAGYESRRIAGLSGGEQQRVALARALAPSPQLLMLDEPIGALDRDLRSQLMAEMRYIFRDLGLTVLYVTHDQEEAFGLADRVAVMRDGSVLRDGTPRELWSDPRTAFVARFMGRDNVVTAAEADRLREVLSTGAPKGPVAIDPAAVAVTTSADGMGRVIESRFAAGDHRTTVDLAGVTLVAATDRAFDAGAPVTVAIDRSGVMPLAETDDPSGAAGR